MRIGALLPIIVLLGSGICFGKVQPYDFNTSTLLETCNSYIKVADALGDLSAADKENGGFCLGYLIGLVESHAFYNYMSKKSANKDLEYFCFAKNVDFDQSIRIIVKYIKDHPEKLHLPAVIVVFNALGQYFPCANK